MVYTTRRKKRLSTQRPRKRTARKTKPYKKSIPRTVGFPQSHYVKLIYQHNGSFNLAASALSTSTFNLNSMFDPDQSGVGHQPMYFDQFSAVYKKYCVYACKVQLSFALGFATNNQFYPSLTVLPYVGTFTTTDQQYAAEQKRAYHTILIPAQRPFSYKGFFRNHQLLGITKAKLMSEDNYSALVTADPVTATRLMIMTQNNDTGTSQPIVWRAHLTYYAKMFDPVIPPGS